MFQMIDSLNLNLGVTEAGGIDFLKEVPSHLDDANRSEHCFDGCFYVVNGYVGSLKVFISRMSVIIKDSSFCKWCLGNNFKTLTRGDIKLGIEKLSDTLHLPMELAKVTRLDIGQNFVLKNPTGVYLRHLGTLRYAKRLQEPTGLYYAGTNTQLAFYDKVREQTRAGENIPELYKGRNVLRYEIRFLHRLPYTLHVSEVTGRLLYDEAFYMSTIKRWYEAYKAISKINDIQLDFEAMKGKKELYRAGLLALIEQRGGELSLLDEITEAQQRGELNKRQAFEMRTAIKNVCHTTTGKLLKENCSVKELDKKINEAVRFFR